MIRLKAARLVSGSSATSFHAFATVLASLITLRPLVSVPAIDGNFCNCLVVSPAITKSSDSCAVLAASVSVAGPAAVTISVIAWFLASIRSASCEVWVRASEISAEREFSFPSN
ncbi:Uncharacterised protein [Mycobacteroides abscessus subsp. massiliense]|nr:Uncharacterised protein [Mycobacteroides abscessus subsp. massiliense]